MIVSLSIAIKSAHVINFSLLFHKFDNIFRPYFQESGSYYIIAIIILASQRFSLIGFGSVF